MPVRDLQELEPLVADIRIATRRRLQLCRAAKVQNRFLERTYRRYQAHQGVSLRLPGTLHKVEVRR